VTIVAGVDFGTLSARVSIVDSSRGRLGSGTAEYPLERSRHDPDLATQSHDDHMSALGNALRRAIADAGVAGEDIAAIALDTTGSSVVPVGDGLVPLDDYYLWCDHRSWREAAEITARAHEAKLPAIDWCGGVYSSEWGFAKLLHWLRQQRLAWRQGDVLMVHAGVLPAWSVDDTMQRAAEAEAALRGAHYRDFFEKMYGNAPIAWEDDLQGIERLRVIVNAFTRLRYCSLEGEMEFHHKGAPGTQPPGWLPWFDVPGRKSAEATFIIGHWSTLGLINRSRLIALDTGCLWGGELTAVRLEDRRVFAVQCPQVRRPKA